MMSMIHTRKITTSVLTILSAAFATALSAQAQQPAQMSTRQIQAAPVYTGFTAPQTVAADLGRIDSVLNNTRSFVGEFTQYGPDGAVDKGRIYFNRPGRMRLEYDTNPVLVVTDGATLAQYDQALETMDRVPLSSTPLNYFLKENVNLARDTEVVGLIKTPSDIFVTSRDGSGEMEGQITMVFDPATLAFRSWIIRDAFGGDTRLVMSNIKYNPQLDPRLFVLRDETRRDRRR